MAKYTDVLERIADALERIAAAQEDANLMLADDLDDDLDADGEQDLS